MTININSVTDCYNAWKNYYYGNNTQKISQEEIGAIESNWSSQLDKWKNRAENDENEYVISDEDYDDARDKGEDSAEETTGVESDSWKKNALGTGVRAAGSIAGTAFCLTMLKQTGNIGQVFKSSDFIKRKGFKYDGYQNGTKINAYTAAVLAIATAAAYYIKKPNKEEVEACEQLRDEMLPEAQGELNEADAQMAEASENVADMTEEANAMNEDANEQMEEQKTQFDTYKESLLAIKEKIASGEKLTDSEKELYNELIPILEEIGVTINDISEETMDAVGQIYDDIDGQQEVFDTSAETVANVEGLTDYAQDLDRATRTMCTVEAISQGLNAVSGAAAGAKLIASSGGLFNIWNLLLGSAAIAAAGFSTKYAIDQKNYLKEVNDEVDLRKQTQNLDEAVGDAYDEQIDIYNDNIGIVEDLDMEVPDDLEIPEEEIEPEGDTLTGKDTDKPDSTDNKTNEPDDKNRNKHKRPDV